MEGGWGLHKAARVQTEGEAMGDWHNTPLLSRDLNGKPALGKKNSHLTYGVLETTMKALTSPSEHFGGGQEVGLVPSVDEGMEPTGLTGLCPNIRLRAQHWLHPKAPRMPLGVGTPQRSQS